MAKEKRIIIGCDNAVNLSGVLHGIKDTARYACNIITAARAADLEKLSRSFSPDLLILCFRNNQSALNELNTAKDHIKPPVLCITGKWENETMQWQEDSIVFTCPLEHIHSTDYLRMRVNSIFLLHENNPDKTNPAHVPTPAFAQHQPAVSKSMSRYVLELDQKTEVLLKIKERITALYPRLNDPARSEMMSILNAIKISANNKDLWDDFKLYFEETNPGFLISLARKHPFLTPVDLKYCCYLKMNMSNDDIKNVFGISLESVRTHKYRLKKKMSLDKDENLRNYLRSVG